MLIRKTQQPAEYPENAIHDAYTESTSDTYCCNYINSHQLSQSIIHQVTPIVGSNYAGFGNTYYYQVGSRVHLHIAIQGITAKTQTHVYTFPTGISPISNVITIASGSTGGVYASIQINPDGKVYLWSEATYVFGDIDFDVFSK